MKLEPREVFEKLCRLDPNSALSHFTLGRSHYLHGDFSQALVSLKKAIELDADYLLNYLLLGQSYEKLGLIQEARRTYQAGEEQALALGENTFVGQFHALRLTMPEEK